MGASFTARSETSAPSCQSRPEAAPPAIPPAAAAAATRSGVGADPLPPAEEPPLSAPGAARSAPGTAQRIAAATANLAFRHVTRIAALPPIWASPHPGSGARLRRASAALPRGPRSPLASRRYRQLRLHSQHPVRRAFVHIRPGREAPVDHQLMGRPAGGAEPRCVPIAGTSPGSAMTIAAIPAIPRMAYLPSSGPCDRGGFRSRRKDAPRGALIRQAGIASRVRGFPGWGERGVGKEQRRAGADRRSWPLAPEGRSVAGGPHSVASRSHQIEREPGRRPSAVRLERRRAGRLR